jgi:hypothetical protein
VQLRTLLNSPRSIRPGDRRAADNRIRDRIAAINGHAAELAPPTPRDRAGGGERFSLVQFFNAGSFQAFTAALSRLGRLSR